MLSLQQNKNSYRQPDAVRRRRHWAIQDPNLRPHARKILSHFLAGTYSLSRKESLQQTQPEFGVFPLDRRATLARPGQHFAYANRDRLFNSVKLSLGQGMRQFY